MKIIDWDRKGNVVRLYLGDDSLEDWWGDDWNDKPYECNAGKVYDRFITGQVDIGFAFDDYLVEAQDDNYGEGSGYCKNDFKTGTTPFLIIIDKSDVEDFYKFKYDGKLHGIQDYQVALKYPRTKMKIFLGDKIEETAYLFMLFGIEILDSQRIAVDAATSSTAVI